MKGLHNINKAGLVGPLFSREGAAKLTRITVLDQFKLDRFSEHPFALCAFCEPAHTPCDKGRQSEWIQRIAGNGHPAHGHLYKSRDCSIRIGWCAPFGGCCPGAARSSARAVPRRRRFSV